MNSGWPGISRPFHFAGLFCLHRADRTCARGDNAFTRQLIGPLVHGMTGMAFDPVPVHLVMAERLIEPLPQVDVLDRLLVRGTPAVLVCRRKSRMIPS